LVPYAGNRSNRFFVVQVTDVDVKCCEMTFLRKSDDNVKSLHFPQENVPIIDQRNSTTFVILS
jgi:hypothetical protein